MGQSKAIVLHPDIHRLPAIERQYRLDEAKSLTHALGLSIIHSEAFQVNKPRAGTLLGQGKIEEISAIIEAQPCDVVIVDTQLSPIQQRNLEKDLNVKVLDRTALILEIFGARAQTREGVLQVELAALTYQKSRLVRSWTHLERQRGGLGFIGGPGESQMELDRRMINQRIRVIKRDLEKVKQTRSLHRRKREKIPYDVVSLVGYTNAGKSTLFNVLTGASVLEKDQLFATLDPTLRSLTLPHGRKVILSDTVGFVSDLPHELVAAFQATLEEVVSADIILHVHDVANPEEEKHTKEVNKVLEILGVNPGSEKIIHVYNKMDLLSEDELAEKSEVLASRGNSLLVSAMDPNSLHPLRQMIEAQLQQEDVILQATVPAHDGEALAWLYRRGNVKQSKNLNETFKIDVELSPADVAAFQKAYPDYV